MKNAPEKNRGEGSDLLNRREQERQALKRVSEVDEEQAVALCRPSKMQEVGAPQSFTYLWFPIEHSWESVRASTIEDLCMCGEAC